MAIGYADMSQPSIFCGRVGLTESQLVLILTAALTFVHGIVVALRFFLREKNVQNLGLSGIEWVAYTVGPVLVSPVLLFGVLYFVGTSLDQLPSLTGLVPVLLIAVFVGTFLGQFVGEELFTSGWTPLAQAGSLDILFRPDLRSLPYWRDLVVPPIRSVLTAVAAVALAGSASE